MEKKKANPKAGPKESRLDNTSGHAQRKRLLAHIHLYGFVTTITARSHLNVMMPAARIKELREAGHPIKTHRLTLMDDQGRTHHGVALYYLGAMPVLEVAE